MEGILKSILHTCALSVVVLAFSSPLCAEYVSLESRTLIQVKELRGGEESVPLNEYVSLNVSQLPKNASFAVDFRAFMSQPDDRKNMNLYQAAFHIEPLASLTIDGGRFWFLDGFEGTLLDGARFDIMPSDWHVGLKLYGGVPRHLDQGDFDNVTEGLIAGTQWYLRGFDHTAAQLNMRYEKISLGTKNYRENDTFAASCAGSHQFTDFWASPALYGNAEYNIAGKTLDAGSVGFDLYPHWRVALNFEGNYYDVDRNINETTFLEQYLTDEMLQGRQSMDLKLAKNLRLFEEFAYQRFQVPGRGNDTGYIASAGVGHYWKAAELSSRAEYYYGKSWGGTLHGGMLELINTSIKHLTGSASVDVSRYTKVTGQLGTAISAVGSAEYGFADAYSLLVGGEYNRNNWFDHEGRATVQFVVSLDSAKRTRKSLAALRSTRRLHEI